MSVLGALLDDADTIGPYGWVRELLAEARRGGHDFDTAWVIAMRRVGGLDHHMPSGTESVHDFARARFERAYYGLDPSIPTCQATTACHEPAVHGDRCRAHGPDPRQALLDDLTRQEAIA